MQSIICRTTLHRTIPEGSNSHIVLTVGPDASMLPRPTLNLKLFYFLKIANFKVNGHAMSISTQIVKQLYFRCKIIIGNLVK